MAKTPDLDQAREWALRIKSEQVLDTPFNKKTLSAASVIQSLPDEWIDANKLRELVEAWGQRFITSDADLLLSDLRGLMPTLADTEWDDNVHPYMEAVTISGRRHILLAPMGDTAVSENTILAAEHDGGMPVLVPAEHLFPTGRYARLSMPDEHPADAEDGPEPDQPRPEDAPVKEPWLVEFRGERYIGARDQYDAPNWALARMDGTNIHFAYDREVALVYRLVPDEHHPATDAEDPK